MSAMSGSLLNGIRRLPSLLKFGKSQVTEGFSRNNIFFSPSFFGVISNNAVELLSDVPDPRLDFAKVIRAGR